MAEKLNFRKFGTIIFVLLASLVAPILVFFPAYEFFLWTSAGFDSNYRQINRCLDKENGCWDFNLKVCRKTEPDAKKLCADSTKLSGM